MKVSTSLFNKQQVESFSKLNEDIQSLQNKISSGKNIIRRLMTLLERLNFQDYNRLKKDLINIQEMLITQ